MMNRVKTIKANFLMSIEEFSSNNNLACKYIYRSGNEDLMTFKEYGLAVKRVALYMQKVLKVKPGERVGILADNRPEWGMAYFAINYIGAEVVPIDAKYNINEIDFIVENSNLQHMLTSLNQYDKVVELVSLKKRKSKFIIFDNVKLENDSQVSFWEIANDTTLNDFSKIDEIEVKEEDIASIIYTSGTTGGAKGVLLSNKNIVSDVFMIIAVSPYVVGDKMLSILPLHHTFETSVGLLTMFFTGVTNVYIELISPTNIIKTIKSEKINGMVVVPLFIVKIYDKITKEIEKSMVSTYMVKALSSSAQFLKKFGVENADAKMMSVIKKKAGFESMKVFFCGAAPMPADVGVGMERLGFCLMQGYGLTEASPVVSVNRPNDNKHGSIGKPLPGVEVRIDNVDQDGVGEIVVKGDNVMVGYFNDQKATDEVLINGELYTGDLGYIDEDGFIFISGRSKNILVTAGGKNIYPEAIEELLNRNDFVLESVILGMKEANNDGEVPYAVIVPDIDMIETTLGVQYSLYEKIQDLMKEVVKDINKSLPEFKRIKGYKISMEELPKTSTKKIKRYLLKNEINMIE